MRNLAPANSWSILPRLVGICSEACSIWLMANLWLVHVLASEINHWSKQWELPSLSGLSKLTFAQSLNELEIVIFHLRRPWKAEWCWTRNWLVASNTLKNSWDHHPTQDTHVMPHPHCFVVKLLVKCPWQSWRSPTRRPSLDLTSPWESILDVVGFCLEHATERPKGTVKFKSMWLNVYVYTCTCACICRRLKKIDK